MYYQETLTQYYQYFKFLSYYLITIQNLKYYWGHLGARTMFKVKKT